MAKDLPVAARAEKEKAAAPAQEGSVDKQGHFPRPLLVLLLLHLQGVTHLLGTLWEPKDRTKVNLDVY